MQLKYFAATCGLKWSGHCLKGFVGVDVGRSVNRLSWWQNWARGVLVAIWDVKRIRGS